LGAAEIARHGAELVSNPWAALPGAAIAAAPHVVPVADRLVTRGARAAFGSADAALSALARTVRAGNRPSQWMIDAAIKAGARQASVNAIVARAPKGAKEDDGSDITL